MATLRTRDASWVRKPCAEPTTRPSLLIRLRDHQDHEAWRSFNHLYVPLIFDFCRARGLQEQDAAEVTQETLLQITKSIETFDYQSERGRFRVGSAPLFVASWLNFTVSENECPNCRTHRWRKFRRQLREPGTMFGWNTSCKRWLIKVRGRLASQTWAAFQMVWLDHRYLKICRLRTGSRRCLGLSCRRVVV